MLRLNFMIETVPLQMERQFGRGAGPTGRALAERLTKAFSVLLPAFGIISIPINGILTDRFGLITAWSALFATMLGHQLLLWSCTGVFLDWGFPWLDTRGMAELFDPLLESIQFQMRSEELIPLLALCLFCFSRPLLYTVIAVHMGRTYGFATFGAVYGLAFTIAGM